MVETNHQCLSEILLATSASVLSTLNNLDESAADKVGYQNIALLTECLMNKFKYIFKYCCY